MAFSDLSIVGFLKSKMSWHQSRQNLLAENVANSDTPNYRPRDLKPMTFDPAASRVTMRPVGTARTHASHVAGKSISGEQLSFDSTRGTGWEITPGGNSVILEEQMMKVSENQFDYQLASSLYTRSLGLIKTALGRNG